MKGFAIGVLVASLIFGAYWFGRLRAPAPPPPPAQPTVTPAPSAPKVVKKKRRRGARLARAGGGGNEANANQAAPGYEEPSEPEPVKLSAADLKPVGQGDDLSKPDVVRMDMSDTGGSRELSQDDIDERFRPREGDILGCIMRARPDEETYVPGRVTVKFRIQRSGSVRGVRVEGPAILMKGGLFGCVRGVVLGIRFPPSNGSQVVSYPFTLS